VTHYVTCAGRSTLTTANARCSSRQTFSVISANSTQSSFAIFLSEPSKIRGNIGCGARRAGSAGRLYRGAVMYAAA